MTPQFNVLPRLRRPLWLGALMLAWLMPAAAAAAATTRYAALKGSSTPSNCTNVAAPCSLVSALSNAQAGDTLSLGPGSYDVSAVPLPPVPLHWVTTDPQARPELTSTGAAPTLTLTPAQSGSSFEGLLIDHANAPVQPALALQAGVAATVRGTVVMGPRCIDAAASGPFTIEGSTLSGTTATTCATLGAMSTVRHSTISGPAVAVTRENPPPVAVTSGLIEDSTVTDGLGLAAPTAVARRVRASGGATAISGEGLVVDSLATSAAAGGAAITADVPGGGTLRVVNTTAASKQGPALLVAPAFAPTGPIVPNDLEVTNSIARGTPADVQVVDRIACFLATIADCPMVGRLHIDHSDFVTRAPLASARDAALITEGAGNSAADPMFVDSGGGDYHLRGGSPAIDAGTASDVALPADLDGHSRAQGAAPDLGAFESSPPPPPPPPPPVTPVLSHLAVRPNAIHVWRTQPRRSKRRPARIVFTLSERADVRISFAKAQPTNSRLRRCRRSGSAARGCTRFVPVGSLTVVARAGANAFSFTGVLARGRLLQPGAYMLTATPTDAAHHSGQPRTARLTVLRGPA